MNRTTLGFLRPTGEREGRNLTTAGGFIPLRRGYCIHRPPAHSKGFAPSEKRHKKSASYGCGYRVERRFLRLTYECGMEPPTCQRKVATTPHLLPQGYAQPKLPLSGITVVASKARHQSPPLLRLPALDAGSRATPTNTSTQSTRYRIFAPLVRHDDGRHPAHELYVEPLLKTAQNIALKIWLLVDPEHIVHLHKILRKSMK